MDTGHVLLDEAQRLLGQAEKAIQSTKRTHAGQSGRLVIGFIPSAAPEVLPRILRKYHALYPDVIVELEAATLKNTESLLESTMSVAFVRSPTLLSRELFCFETILRDYVAALPDSHPLAKQESIRIKTLANEPLIVPPLQPGWGYADSIFQIFRDYRIVPRIAEEATGSLAVIALVAGGFGVALVPASLGNLRLAGVTYRPIKGPCRTSDLTLVWNRDSRASTVRRFLEVVRKEYAGAGRRSGEAF